MKHYRENHSEGYKIIHKANVAIARLVKKGIITKMPCGVCDSEKTEAHHPDYSKPLEVVWLCQKHHYWANRKNKEKDSSAV